MKRILFVALGFIAPAFLAAKGPIVKVSVGGLASPLEITAPAISRFNPYAGPGVIANVVEETAGFIVNWSDGTVAPPPENLPRYDVSFYVGYPENGLAYVVKYVFDPSNSQGYVYLLGPSDAQYKLNRMRHGHGLEGNWLRATPERGDLPSVRKPVPTGFIRRFTGGGRKVGLVGLGVRFKVKERTGAVALDGAIFAERGAGARLGGVD